MAALGRHLKDPEYVNWVKNTVALKITQDALKPFVLQELPVIHRSFTDSVPYGMVCSSCDVSQAPSCPINVCNIYMRKIKDYHRLSRPSFRNTNARNWSFDAWEIAKCFMPQIPVYGDSTPTSADFSAIINFIINCIHFDCLVWCNLNEYRNVFNQARTMRNALMFSENLTISTAMLERNLDLLVRLLKSLKVEQPNFREAVEQLIKLKEGNDLITLDGVLDARKEAVLAISEVSDVENQEREDFANSVINQLRNDIQTRSPSSKAQRNKLIGNFIIRCKYSLIKLVQKKSESEKPKRYQQHEWNLQVFLTNIKENQRVEALVDRHKDVLYPEDGSQSDIKGWGIFLLCHILCLETRSELPICPTDYVQKLRAMRNKILAGQSGLGEKDLHSLYDSLDEPLRTEVEQMQASKDIIESPDTQRLLRELEVWTQDEETMHATTHNRRQEPVPKKPDPCDGKFVEEDGLGYYQTDGKTGYLLILNFEKDRNFTRFDVDNLKKFFSNELLFEVDSPRDRLESDFTTIQVMESLESAKEILSDDDESKKYYCFICVIMSHGHQGVFKTKDGQVEIETIRKMFSNKNMSKFAGKPKVFFIQACQGPNTQGSVGIDDEADDEVAEETEVIDESDNLVAIPNDADVLFAYATTPGYKAFRRRDEGSWFIKECVRVFRELKERCHLEDMLVTVRERVALTWETDSKNNGKQMPYIWSTLTKRLRLRKPRKTQFQTCPY